ncbi:MAG: EAL domain-containing protein [Lachnospiraceae bacterium]|nr:EAL domain-containing protein [Lachnospiraceae bacterium]
MRTEFMNWNMDYGLASLFVLAVLLIYNMARRELPMRKNFVFNTLLITIAVADILDVFSTFAQKHSMYFPAALIYSSVLFYHAVIVVIPVLFCIMVIIMTGRLGIASRNRKIFTILAFAAVELLILTNPLTGFVFSYNVTDGYTPKPGIIVMFAFGLSILFYGCYYISKHRENTHPSQRIAAYFFTIVTFLSCLTQTVLFPGLPIICFGFTISVLIMYIAAQNTDSYRDQRTGLFSKDGFNALQKELFRERKKSSFFCFTFANYDVLKSTYGDEIMLPCLRDIAYFLRSEVCSGDVIPFYVHNGRFLLMKTGFYDFSGEKLLIDERFRKPWVFSDVNFQFSPAYAYISSELKMSRMMEVHSLIDKALSEAFKNGAFSFIAIDEDILYQTRHEIKIRKALDKAIDNDTLEIWLQPIWNAKTNRVSSAEALVRINDEELGLIYPDEFIQTAEANGSIMKLGRQVYRKVCEFIATHDIRKYGVEYIEINLSPIQCLNEHLADELIAIRKTYGISSRLINLEITETAASDSHIMVENMLHLSRDGFSFSLDDYGTGYSNLVNMLSLPLSIIKIDKSIVWSYFDQTFAIAAGGENYIPSPFEGGSDNNILEDLIPMFQARGLKVVCEGVETREMARVLEELGCDYMQGFFFSKPVPERDFMKYVKSMNKT